MKKILPIVALIGASALVVGISNINPQEEKKEAFISHINDFRNNLDNYTQTSNVVQTAMNNYLLTLESEDLNLTPPIQTLEETENNLVEDQDSSLNDNLEADNLNINSNHVTKDIQDEDLVDKTLNNTSGEVHDNESLNENVDSETLTLYSLSSDIENSCDEFCELKENISKAILETQNLIKKVQNKEIELTNEQRLYISEQAQQLKSLGRQLSNVTTELSFNLSDINSLMLSNDGDLSNLSMKYLIVLDNLVNGNEMLQSGLSSLNLINQMFNMQTKNIPSNNKGRILYGFKKNDNDPIIKDYYINNDGELIENSKEAVDDPYSENLNNENNLVDTYQNNNLKSNIDTYNNRNLPSNIDTFFNTALFNNEFMYGNGYGNAYQNNLPLNPNVNGYPYRGTTNGVNSENNTQYNKTEENSKDKKRKKKFQLKKNIDTFKDENEPDIKTKLGNIKNSISSFLGLNDKIDKPISRYSPTESD